MNSKKIALGIILLFLGIIGILSLLTMEIPLPFEAEAVLEDIFSPVQIKLLTLINPTIMLIVSVTVGVILYQKVNLRVPVIEKLVGINKSLNFSEVIQYGILGGVLSGILLSIVSLVFNPILPMEFKELGESLQPTLAARFLYGGLSEEILMRFGLMTFIVWICIKIFNATKPIIYWTAIVISAMFFALAHFPIAFLVVENPSIWLLLYLLIGNSIGGIIFGWLYWKKGLESAFIAHMFTHVILILTELMLN